MRSRIVVLLGAICLLGAVSTFGQEGPPAAAAYPIASSTDMNCTGFISGQAVSNDVYLFDGADNDNLGYVRAWLTGEHVFLRSRGGASIPVGTEYKLVRSAKDLLHVSWYDGQGASIRSLGSPYQTMGRVKVVRSTPEGAVAEITNACRMITRGDIAIPMVSQPTPQYTPSTLDRYAPSNGKIQGAITVGVDNASFFGGGKLAYINLGTSDGVSAGQKFRIFHILREEPGAEWTLPPAGPRQTVGELIVLSSEEKSSLVMVTQSIREVRLGDGVEME